MGEDINDFLRMSLFPFSPIGSAVRFWIDFNRDFHLSMHHLLQASKIYIDPTEKMVKLLRMKPEVTISKEIM